MVAATFQRLDGILNRIDYGHPQSFSSFFRADSHATPAFPKRPEPAAPYERFMPQVEALESRAMLTAVTTYVQTNLVSDQAGKAAITDPNLVNVWGLAVSPAAFWVANNGSDNTTVYTNRDVNGNPLVRQSLIVSIAPRTTGAVTNLRPISKSAALRRSTCSPARTARSALGRGAHRPPAVAHDSQRRLQGDRHRQQRWSELRLCRGFPRRQDRRVRQEFRRGDAGRKLHGSVAPAHYARSMFRIPAVRYS